MEQVKPKRRSFDSIGKDTSAPVINEVKRFKSNKTTSTVLNNIQFNPLNIRIATSLIRRVNDSTIQEFALDKLSEPEIENKFSDWAGQVANNEILDYLDGDNDELSVFGIERDLVNDIRELYQLKPDDGIYVGKQFIFSRFSDERLSALAAEFVDSILDMTNNIKDGSLLQDKIKTMNIRGQKYIISSGGHRRVIALAYVDGWQSNQEIEVEPNNVDSMLELYIENNSKFTESKFEKLLGQHRLYMHLAKQNLDQVKIRQKLLLSKSWYFKIVKILKRPIVIDVIKQNQSILDNYALESISAIVDGLADLESDPELFRTALSKKLAAKGSETTKPKPQAQPDTLVIHNKIKQTSKLMTSIIKDENKFTRLFDIVFPNGEYQDLPLSEKYQLLNDKLSSI
ncbi:hypothetical protein [Catenovulum sediminis]|uniref:hypothetical protein n=1 Tax=Catenovulum sediminis TaxID=1740262 RepID=UPI00117E3DB4|nr:hypothetical protein [Catenovulum sediminis]